MRILYSSNAMWANSGYGVQGKHLLPRFQALGHDVAMFAWYGLQGGFMKMGDIPCYPMFRDWYGNDVIAHHAQNFKADLVITLIDIWVLNPDTEALCGVPWLAWFPIDHAPVSASILERVRKCSYPVQYSKFGLAETEKAGVPCGYIPHGVSAEYTPGDQRAARKSLGLPQDAFLISMVAANKGFPDRKGFQWQLESFRDFQRTHPEALLYLHTWRNSPDGLDLDALIHVLGIPITAVRFADQYMQVVGLTEAYMADMYRASDVLLAASMAEGFGIPIAEAQACGTPVITTNFSSMPELTVNGICTEPAGKWYRPDFLAWQVIPSVPNVTKALEAIYDWGTAKRQKLSARGVAHMRQHYDWDAIVRDYWAPMLDRVARGDAINPQPVPASNGQVVAVPA